ncbi:MAG: Eco29kI family restriction endonuclease [Acidobacteriaceae bacterium]
MPKPTRTPPKSSKPFNPLEKKHLGESVAAALLEQPMRMLPLAERFQGAGVYAIYYAGDHELYRTLKNASMGEEIPIYIGKAIPAGGRKGGFVLDAPAGNVLFSRIAEHCESIKHSQNLKLSDFSCRYLVADDIWIPLGESLLIEKFAPLWNKIIDGFGNHTPGAGRFLQQKSSWDVLHEGRPWANKLQPSKKSLQSLKESIDSHFAALNTLATKERK